MIEEHTAQGTWKRPGSAHARSRSEPYQCL
jgi:hypothetical protein